MCVATSDIPNNITIDVSGTFFFSEAKTPISPFCKSENQNTINYHSEVFTLLKPKNVYRFFKLALFRYYPNYGLEYIERKSVNYNESDLPPPSF